MNSAYRKMMEQQCVSDGAQQAFYEKVQSVQMRKRKPVFVKAAAIAACICLVIPLTAYAVEAIFGISVVEIIEDGTLWGKPGAGYRTNYPDAISRPLSDFPEAIQKIDGYTQKVYESWEDAENELGINLVENTFLSGEGVAKDFCYLLEVDGIKGRKHCFASYEGKDGQFYRATVTAAYRHQDMHITVRSAVTAEHPAISEEDEELMHWSGVRYDSSYVEEIVQEQYATANGINATIVTVDWTGSHATDYEASFSANGASYRITVRSYDPKQDAQSKDVLIEILEGFVF